MNIQIEEVQEKDKEKLFRFLQLSLYDGSQYIKNEINQDILFEYKWFENYFTDEDRNAYLVKENNQYVGMVMVNENLKFLEKGKCIAEFLIIPQARRKHIGKTVAFDIFNKFPGDWEVQPMENNKIAYSFWKNIIKEYTNDHYEVKNDGKEDVFIFHSAE